MVKFLGKGQKPCQNLDSEHLWYFFWLLFDRATVSFGQTQPLGDVMPDPIQNVHQNFQFIRSLY